MRITFKAFDSKMASREKLFKAALEFANKLDPHDLITITHSEDRDNIVLTIWYFTDEPESKGKAAALQKETPPAGTPVPQAMEPKRTFQGVIPKKSPDTHHGMPPIPPPPPFSDQGDGPQ